MRRNYLKVGDKSSAGGTAIDGISCCTHHGTELTFLGGKVVCPACNTTGYIAPSGPRWQNNFMGKDPALDGDPCICQCDPPPVMFASQDSMYDEFQVHELAAMGFGPSGQPLSTLTAAVAGSALTAIAYDDRFVLRDYGGRPLAYCAYAVRRETGYFEYGETDAAGHTHLLASVASAEEINVYIAG